NATHQMKKLTLEDQKALRDRLQIPITDEELEKDPYKPPYYMPDKDDPALRYMLERREALGGYLPSRHHEDPHLELPGDKAYKMMTKGSGKQKVA
ncbi:hypothetical protein QP229_11735, partial [Streptococcus agalactiae]|nr:hypothetical protein [Streptococcus agalactiae]